MDADVSPGSTSQFDVLVDGRVVYSKQARGRFPAPGEITALVRS